MSDQQPKKTDGRPPRTGGSKPPHSGTPAGKRPPSADKSKKSAPQEKVRYAVIITNVENDFGKLHNASLPYYCGLRAEYEETLDVERLVKSGGPKASNLVSATRGCGYAVHCRTETRSAEVSFYGPAEADFSAMQLQKHQRPARSTSTSSSTPKAHVAATSASASPQTAAAPPPEDPTAPLAESEDAVADVAAPADEEAVLETTSAATTNAVEALALRLRRMRYFEDKLPVHVHLPGHAAGEVLLRQGGEEVMNATSTTAAVDADGAEDAAMKLGAKRSREEADGDDGVDDCDSEDGEGEGTEKDGEGEGTEKDGEGEGTEKDSVVSTNTATGGKPSRAKGKRAMVIKQFPNRQRDFVTAVAALPARVPLRVVRCRLHDVPGYMSCWSLDEKRVRVVFRDNEALFKAKELLDQFGLGTGLRVTLMLSDPLTRDNEEFVRAQEAEEAQ